MARHLSTFALSALLAGAYAFEKSFDPAQTDPYDPQKSSTFQRAPGTSVDADACTERVLRSDYTS
jgi:hypothetical protein